MARELIHVNGNINMTFDVECLKSTQLFRRQKGLCFYCGVKFKRKVGAKNRPTKDHFFPKSKDNHLKNNKVLSCLACNLAKGDRVPTNEEIKKYLKLYDGIVISPEANL